MKIGVMGGTFDPIHNGHLVTAEEARFQFNLDKVIFMPSANPPHKADAESSPGCIRYKMVQLGICENEFFLVSDIEILRGGLSYTIDTLRELHQAYGKNTELLFITGADAVLEILTWKDPADVLSECRFIAATRPGYPLEKLKEALPECNSNRELTADRVVVMEVPSLAISSTDIRKRVAEKRPFRYLVPELVWLYIIDTGLYLK